MATKIEKVAQGYVRWRCFECQAAGVPRSSKKLCQNLAKIHRQSCTAADGERFRRARRLLGVYQIDGLEGADAIRELMKDLEAYCRRQGLDISDFFEAKTTDDPPVSRHQQSHRIFGLPEL